MPEIKCNKCGQPIKFLDSQKTPSGKFIPLNMDNSPHDCQQQFQDRKETQKEVTAFSKEEEFNELLNNNVALMTRCYQDANDVLKKYAADGYINPECLTKTAVTLFLTLVKK